LDLKQFIRDVPDFPEPGIIFRDITPLLQNADAFQDAVDQLAAAFLGNDVDVVAGIESRGFVFAAPLAYKLGLPLVPIRKPGKLPAARMSVEYSLEYGQGQLDIHQDAVRPGQRVLVVDDLLATGGTAIAAIELIEMLGAQVQGLAFLVELDGLAGRERLRDRRIVSIVRYS
jgi:adenine phosphoribosyltransferase